MADINDSGLLDYLRRRLVRLAVECCNATPNGAVNFFEDLPEGRLAITLVALPHSQRSEDVLRLVEPPEVVDFPEENAPS